MHVAAVAGTRGTLSNAYRTFVLRHLAESDTSRRPYVFYNTWNHQERVHHWTHRPYLAEMNAERMLAEIDVAHRIGVEVFVIDTGWYDRTGDWRVDRTRFPDGLGEIRDRLERYGMLLGLWFGPTSAARTSRMLERNLANRRSWRGERPTARSIWETEESEELCLVSSYADDFADELIRCARDLGVRYFKWDAIDQYGCDSPDHHHGDQTHTPAERADSYAFQQPLYLSRVVERLTRAVPDAIVDFDVTEGHRCVGLSFLSVGKYFLINNGPYFSSFDIPADRDVQWENPNVFFHPGSARDWVVRTPLTYDTWIPSILFLSHYLPDDPAANQDASIGSLVLGQNGLWGDLVGISGDGVERMSRLLALYRQVRADVTSAQLRRVGIPGGQVEIYEKVSATTGRGVVVIFANGVGRPFDEQQPMRVRHVVDAPVADPVSTSGPNVTVGRHVGGRGIVEADFVATGAAIAFFGAGEQAG
jgi:alpha-galactosidase